MTWRMFFRRLSLGIAILVGAHVTQFDYTQWQYWLTLTAVCAGIDVFLVLGDEK